MTTTASTPGRQKREASNESEQACLGAVSKRLKRMSVGGTGDPADVVLLSNDGQRFPISSRLLPSTVLLSSASTADSVSITDGESTGPTELALPFSAATLEYVLQFFENRPVNVREPEFPRDWETMRALSTLSIWRGIDSFQQSLSSSRKEAPEPHLLAPAFCFGVNFSYPLRPLAIAAAKHCEADPAAVKELTSGLMEGAREVEFDGEQLGKVIELTTWLLARATHLHAARNAALSTLVAFDDEYECEHSCRGVVWAKFAQGFTTTNKRKLRKMSEEERAFDCNDCDVRWDAAMEKLVEGLESLPSCPFPST